MKGFEEQKWAEEFMFVKKLLINDVLQRNI